MNAVAIVCSRLESKRLPGKALMKIAGKPVIQHIVKRLQGFPMVIAVPPGQQSNYNWLLDGPYTEGTGVGIYFSEPDSPLHRMAAVVRSLDKGGKTDAGHGWGPVSYDWIVRVTHDDPLIDAQTVKELLAECEKQGAGYGCTPDIVEGAGVEVIHRDNLLAAAERRKEPTEFVSYFVRGEGMPRPGIVRMKPRASICRPYRLTLDYHEDALVLEAVLRAVGPDAPLDKVVEFLDRDENAALRYCNRLPDLSVYTAAYNAARWITSAISSVGSLCGLNNEYVIVNDGSTDETAAVIARRIGLGEEIQAITNEENMGLASSSNRAVSACRGKAVMRLDADDFLDPLAGEHIKAMLDMIRSGFHAVYPAYYVVNSYGGVLGMLGDPRTHHHVGGALFDKAFLNELRFREGLRNWDGLELYQRMVKAGAKIGYYNTPTWCYRQHDKSMSKTNTEQREAERAILLQRTSL